MLANRLSFFATALWRYGVISAMWLHLHLSGWRIPMDRAVPETGRDCTIMETGDDIHSRSSKRLRRGALCTLALWPQPGSHLFLLIITASCEGRDTSRVPYLPFGNGSRKPRLGFLASPRARFPPPRSRSRVGVFAWGAGGEGRVGKVTIFGHCENSQLGIKDP